VSEDGTQDDGSPGGEAPAGQREIEVPLRLYKTVTVFSTLIAIVAVVVGFLLLDAATIGTGLLRRAVVGVLRALSILPSEQVLSALFAVAGLLCIAAGAVVYVLGTRFKAPEMAGGDEGES
jgi:predicted membrane channel-forming protein YqfA (hemolysin III family)